jgi:diamine N-acetyltransferase
MFSVYIRPLELKDSQVSFQWRNNPRIWRYTGANPERYISQQIEEDWLREILKRVNERRFAICLSSDHKYIGNIFFTDMQNDEAQLHLFIGEMDFWCRRKAYETICLMLDYGFTELNLRMIYAQINPKNATANVLGGMVGFRKISEYYDSEKQMILDKMIFNQQMYNQQIHIDNRGKEELT